MASSLDKPQWLWLAWPASTLAPLDAPAHTVASKPRAEPLLVDDG